MPQRGSGRLAQALGLTMRGHVTPSVFDLVQPIAAIAALGFVLWALACLVQGYTLARGSHLSARSLMALSTLRDPLHPLYPHARGFFQATIGFSVALAIVLVLQPFVRGVP